MLSSAEVQSACSRTDYRSIRMMYVKISVGVARNGFALFDCGGLVDGRCYLWRDTDFHRSRV